MCLDEPQSEGLGRNSLCAKTNYGANVNKLDESLLAKLPPFKNLGRPQIREILDLATPAGLRQM